MFYTYVLKNKEEKMYIGYTSNIQKRLSQHNQGLNISTKRYLPWKIIYYEACLNKNDAMRREQYLKTTQGARLLKIRLKDYRAESKNLTS